MSKVLYDDYFRDPERSKVLNSLREPSKHCPVYQQCSLWGAYDPGCELRGKNLDEFMEWVQKLFALSDITGQYSLRDALRVMKKDEALKSCEIQRILAVAIREVANEKDRRKAKEYERVQVQAKMQVKKLELN
jgi:hypothetical protein